MATHAAADRQPRVIAAMRRRAARARVAAVVAALAAAWCAHASFALQAASERQPLGAVAPLEPAFEVLRHDLVERCLLGATTLVAAGRTTGPRGATGWPDVY